jgi:hypothetical protein
MGKVKGKLKAFLSYVANFPLIAAAAGTTTIVIGEVPLNFTQQHFSVARVSVVCPSLVTANSLGTFNVRQLRAGAVIATFATLLVAANLAASTPVVIPITAAPDILAGDVIDVQWVQTGAGLALPAGSTVKVEMA